MILVVAIVGPVEPLDQGIEFSIGTAEGRARRIIVLYCMASNLPRHYHLTAKVPDIQSKQKRL
eukprot:4924063-Amphidinium_carterae.1